MPEHYPITDGDVKKDAPFPLTGTEEETDLGPWQDGSIKPSQEGVYLREFYEGVATSEFHDGEWLRDGFFASGIQDAPWRGRIQPAGSSGSSTKGGAAC